MTNEEKTVQIREIINLLYSTLDTIQATAEAVLDAAAIERAALDTLAAPAFFGENHHQTVPKPGEVGA